MHTSKASSRNVQGDNQTIIGRCMLMCPEREKRRRQKEKAIHVLEVGPDERSEVRAVKEYVRAGAGHTLPLPDDLRPPEVLINTMEYLIRNVAERTDYPWHIVYQFISNRIQSIRQDITFQQLEGPCVRYIFEIASKFHLYSQYRLWGSPIDKFDPKLNMDHLQQCMAKLLRSNVNPQPHLPRQPIQDDIHTEYEAYYLLINLGNTEVLTRALDLRFHYHPRLKLAFAINLSLLHNNFVQLFRLVRQLSNPFEKFALLTHVTKIRTKALQTMSSAYSSRTATFPLQLLENWLLMDNRKTTCELCAAHGLEVSGENVLFRKGVFQFSSEDPKLCPFIVPEVQSAQVNDLILGKRTCEHKTQTIDH